MKLIYIVFMVACLFSYAHSDTVVYSWDFNTDGNTNGWIFTQFQNVSVQGGVLTGKTTGTNARMTLETLPSGIQYGPKDYIEIRMRQKLDDNFGYFGRVAAIFRYQTTASNVWDNVKATEFATYGNDHWMIYRGFLGNKLGWAYDPLNPTVKPTQIRLHPNNITNAIVQIDYIRIIRDETPPEFSLKGNYGFKNGDIITHSNPEFRLYAYNEDVSKINKVEYYYRVNGSNDWILDGTVYDTPYDPQNQPSNNLRYAFKYMYNSLPDGVYDFAAKVYDLAGNSNSLAESNDKWIEGIVINSQAVPKIKVKPNEITLPVRKEIPSHNIQWNVWRDLYNPSTGGITQAIDNRVDQLKIPVLRYPGGCFADTFYWKLAIGPVANRPAQYVNGCNPTLSNAGQPKFGLDEFIRYCRARNIEPMFTLRFRYNKLPADDSPLCPLDGRDGLTPFEEALEDAVDLVEYLNSPNDGSNPNGGIDWAAVRAANGHPEPYNVKYFDLANEPWGPDPYGSPKPWGVVGAGVYAAHFLKFYDAMKAVDPNILISAASNIRAQPGTTYDDQLWDQVVMAMAGHKMDAFSGHPYWPYAAWWCSDNDLRYWTTLTSPETMDIALDNTKTLMKKYCGDNYDNLKLWLNEWNVNFTWNSSGAYYDGRSLMSAMALADYWDVMTDNSDIIDNSGWWHMYGGGAYYLFDQSGNITPLFNVFRMFVDHYQDKKVNSYVEAVPVHNWTGWFIAKEMYNVPLLSTTATISDDGKKLSLTVVNKSKEQSISIPIDLGSFAPPGVDLNTSVYRLTGTNPHVANYTGGGWQIINSDAVMTETAATFQNGFTYEFPKHSVVSFLFEKVATAVNSVKELKTLSDGGYISISNKVITAIYDEFIYIQDNDRMYGIRVTLPSGFAGTLNIGDLVNLTGVVTTNQDNERVLTAESIVIVAQ
ncbi:MAG: hypothetical protein SNJ70_04010 [Armatimonadota bacterium]